MNMFSLNENFSSGLVLPLLVLLVLIISFPIIFYIGYMSVYTRSTSHSHLVGVSQTHYLYSFTTKFHIGYLMLYESQNERHKKHSYKTEA